MSEASTTLTYLDQCEMSVGTQTGYEHTTIFHCLGNMLYIKFYSTTIMLYAYQVLDLALDATVGSGMGCTGRYGDYPIGTIKRASAVSFDLYDTTGVVRLTITKASASALGAPLQLDFVVTGIVTP